MAPKPKTFQFGSGGNQRQKQNIPWIEKYRPAKIDDVSHQEEVVRALKKSLTNQTLPHLLFYGPPGTGKTSSIVATARQLFGPLYKDRVLELNASDERGIQVVRDKIKRFAHLAVKKASPVEAQGFPCPPFKIIILDEADSMTPDAQAALRRIIENYTKVTRFCIICNYISRIIEPLASRCAKFRFQPIAESSHRDRVLTIAESEKVNISQEGPEIDCLIGLSGGDLRRSINILQSAHTLCGTDVAITVQILYDVAGHIPDSIVDSLLKTARTGTVEESHLCSLNITADGYGGTQLLSRLLTKLIDDDTVSDFAKARVAEQVAIADGALTDGADEELQLLHVLLQIRETFQTPPKITNFDAPKMKPSQKIAA
eukprot:GHVL01002411.1.p1 GENE.GHVL01002411.1~~GHVL01002411.1.p1  ORF type:complete len:372 (+),score=66.03 GHVL01002411.1:56-1171(+)